MNKEIIKIVSCKFEDMEKYLLQYNKYINIILLQILFYYLNKKVPHNLSLTDSDAQQRSYICNVATMIL